MVRRKDEPEENIMTMLSRVSQDFNKRNPIISRRWCVIEVTPSSKVWDEYDFYWTNQKIEVVSRYFDTPEEAGVWMDEHIPDEDKTLKVREERLRRYSYDRWGTV